MNDIEDDELSKFIDEYFTECEKERVNNDSVLPNTENIHSTDDEENIGKSNNMFPYETYNFDNMETTKSNNMETTKSNNMETTKSNNMETTKFDNMETTKFDNMETYNFDNVETYNFDNVETYNFDNVETEKSDNTFNMESAKFDNMETYIFDNTLNVTTTKWDKNREDKSLQKNGCHIFQMTDPTNITTMKYVHSITRSNTRHIGYNIMCNKIMNIKHKYRYISSYTISCKIFIVTTVERELLERKILFNTNQIEKYIKKEAINVFSVYDKSIIPLVDKYNIPSNKLHKGKLKFVNSCIKHKSNKDFNKSMDKFERKRLEYLSVYQPYDLYNYTSAYSEKGCKINQEEVTAKNINVLFADFIKQHIYMYHIYLRNITECSLDDIINSNVYEYLRWVSISLEFETTIFLEWLSISIQPSYYSYVTFKDIVDKFFNYPISYTLLRQAKTGPFKRVMDIKIRLMYPNIYITSRSIYKTNNITELVWFGIKMI